MGWYHFIRRFFLAWINGTRAEPLARRILLPIFSPSSANSDRLTAKIIRRKCNSNSNCIDIGAYRGDILKVFLNCCPHGKIFAFEPIPDNYHYLLDKYPGVSVLDFALSDKSGPEKYFHVTGRPARSGLVKRKYPDPREEVKLITVQTESLDNLIDENIQIDFLKIDAEGSELSILRGAKQLISKNRPAILFEHGPSASMQSTTYSMQLYDLLISDIDMKIWTLQGWLNIDHPLNSQQFLDSVYVQQNQYFFADWSTQ
jgi:FkbM family methyltransferase